jgi:hypothetical protein
MDIGSLSVDLSRSRILEAVSIVVQAKSLDAVRAQGEAVLKLIATASAPLPEGSGAKVDTEA